MGALITEMGASLVAGVCGLQLSIGTQGFILDKTEFPQEAHKHIDDRIDWLRAYTGTKIAQIVLSGYGAFDSGHPAVASPVVMLAQVLAKARVGGIAVELYRQFEKKQACRIEAMASLLGIPGGKETAGETEMGAIEKRGSGA